MGALHAGKENRQKAAGSQHMTITNTASLPAQVGLSASPWHLLPTNQSLFSHLCLSLSPHSLAPPCYLLPGWGKPQEPTAQQMCLTVQGR